MGAPLVFAPKVSDREIATLLARALNRLLSATVDANLADGIGLSIGEAGAREQSLEALAQWEASRG